MRIRNPHHKLLRPSEQRRPVNLYLSILVDVGLAYQSALGDAAARDFFARQPVPGAVCARVLSDQARRRRTAREQP